MSLTLIALGLEKQPSDYNRRDFLSDIVQDSCIVAGLASISGAFKGYADDSKQTNLDPRDLITQVCDYAKNATKGLDANTRFNRVYEILQPEVEKLTQINLDKALQTMSVEIRSEVATIFNNYGLALRHKGEIEQAKSHYVRSIDIYPTHISFTNLGILFAHDYQDHKTAIEMYDKAIELKADFISAILFKKQSVKKIEAKKGIM